MSSELRKKQEGSALGLHAIPLTFGFFRALSILPSLATKIM
ncbi:hypothetical protein SAMN05660420_01284 [Desulfuromusa kysingii]|uniref:Uncharacterized protein n=1 Tax=Desulfuromusa kysingii TaxID=37625 RepID=A0A1H3YM29_9BACT|nr:hypothetical protein SAMN05660420_01284 [Desulfuromusa kysingii]